MIDVSGYVAEEKMNIAEKYLIPQARRDTGVADEQVHIEPEALQTLIRSYCRESGVRNLQKQVEKIFRKAAFRLVKGQSTTGTATSNAETIKVDRSNLQDFVGKPIFTHDRMYDITPPGNVLLWCFHALHYYCCCFGRLLGWTALRVRRSLHEKRKFKNFIVKLKTFIFL